MLSIKITSSPLTSMQLDSQSCIQLDGWVEVGSEQAKRLDQDHALAIEWLHMGSQDGWFVVDTQGRIFGKSLDNNYFPYHFESGDKKYGYRMSTLAAN